MKCLKWETTFNCTDCTNQLPLQSVNFYNFPFSFGTINSPENKYSIPSDQNQRIYFQLSKLLSASIKCVLYHWSLIRSPSMSTLTSQLNRVPYNHCSTKILRIKAYSCSIQIQTHELDGSIAGPNTQKFVPERTKIRHLDNS